MVAAIVPMLTMLPPPWSRMTGATHWLIRSGPSRLTAKILRQSSSVMSATPMRDGVDAGVVDQHVDAPEPLDDRVDEAGDGVPVADVTGQAEGLDAGRGRDLLRHLVAQVLLAAADHDRGAASARPCAIARPMPLVEPVTIATLPVRSKLTAVPPRGSSPGCRGSARSGSASAHRRSAPWCRSRPRPGSARGSPDDLGDQEVGPEVRRGRRSGRPRRSASCAATGEGWPLGASPARR